MWFVGKQPINTSKPSIPLIVNYSYIFANLYTTPEVGVGSPEN